MNALVVYDSAYSNTEKIASVITDALASTLSVTLRKVQEVSQEDISRYDIVYIGSPTQGGKPTEPITAFLANLPGEAWKEKVWAVFDTRFAIDAHGIGLKLLMKTIGFAAPKIATQIKQSGGKLATEPKGFIVTDKKGPLADGELENAASWAISAIHGS